MVLSDCVRLHGAACLCLPALVLLLQFFAWYCTLHAWQGAASICGSHIHQSSWTAELSVPTAFVLQSIS